MMHLTNERSGFDNLNYSQIPHRDWISRLDEICLRQAETIRAKVFWGDHERTRGIYDFSKTSRLRIEKFFQLAHERKLKIELCVGLPLGGSTFPDWVRSMSFNSLVFNSGLTNEPGSLALTEIASLDEPGLISVFIDFLSELFSIISLYRAPEGPICKIKVDLAVEEASCTSSNSTYFVATLNERYKNIEWFNQVFGTNFRDFQTVTGAMALKVLMKRRFWLTAFEQKWASNKRIDVLNSKIQSISACFGIEDLLNTQSKEAEKGDFNSEFQLLMDGTLLWETTLGTFPWAPDGVLTEQAAWTFRINQYLKYWAHLDSIRFRVLPFQKAVPVQGSVVSVISGKYLSSIHKAMFEEYLVNGGMLFFPFGLPHYDDRLNPISWAGVHQDRVRRASNQLQYVRHNVGKIWFPVSSWEVSDDLWANLKAAFDFIHQESGLLN